MKINDFPNSPSTWFSGSDADNDIVISNRVRLARNISGYPYILNSTVEQKREIIDQVLEARKKCEFLRDIDPITIEELSPVERHFLMERHIISREMASYSGDCAILVSQDEKISIMINEEDHIRLQGYGSGLSIMETWKFVDGIDDELNTSLEYDFHGKYGYLTACPTNVGTGLRASVMVHLPGLVKIQEIDQVTSAIRQIGMDVRGSFGEGSKRVGNFFQVSNQITLGLSEEEILENIVRVTREIINYEEAARERLVNEERPKLEDEIWRALGAVSYNRLLDSNEALEQISKVRLGLGLGIVKNIEYSMLNEITLGVLPGHLQRRVRKKLDPEERDMERARYVREKFARFN